MTPKTDSLAFWPCSNGENMLFAVQAGIPTKQALGHASCLLAQCIAVAYAATYDENAASEAMYGAIRLAEMAKCIVDAAIYGLEEDHER